jgi:hypothetical protein
MLTWHHKQAKEVREHIMRMQRVLAGAVLGGALVLGGTGLAQAAEPSPVVAASETNVSETNVEIMASWHFYRAYWSKAACLTEGDALGGTFKCEYKKGNDGKWKWFLYRWY